MRQLPQNLEAERAVLGGIMIWPAALDGLAGKLSEEDFAAPAHRIIWRTLLALTASGQPTDAVTVGEWLDRDGHPRELQSLAIEMQADTPSAANVMAYAKIVRGKAMLRTCMEIGLRLSESAAQASDGMAVADEAIRALMDLAGGQADHECTLKDALREANADIIDAYQKRGQLRGVTLGIKQLDDRLGGAHDGDLIIFGARPAMGKTALLLNILASASGSGVPCGFISGEQPRMQIAQRLIAINGPLAAERMRNGHMEEEDWARLTRSYEGLLQRQFWIYDRSAPTLDEVCRQARAWKRKHGIRMLGLDYVQRIRVPKAKQRNEEVAEVARTLKDLARDLGLPIVALAQVVKDVETRGDKRPNQGDLANSDELTREADVIAMLYRDEVYNPETQDRGIAELLIEKNRHGPCGRVRTAWFGDSMRFCNLEAA
jgi:replicative DNA helicase